MSNETKRRVTQELRPAYYDDFHCLMGACSYSCCAGSWEISFSKKDYLKLKQCKPSPELSGYLFGGMRRYRKDAATEQRYAAFDTSGGVCPLLTEEGLCRLQLEKDGDVLPFVCRSFPRRTFYSTDYLERSLSPACEGVLALLWDLPQGVDFVVEDLPAPVELKAPAESPLLDAFQDVRSMCIDFIQDRRFPLAQRILLMGVALKELADGETDIDKWLRRAAVLRDTVDPSALLPTGDRELEMFLTNKLRILLGVPVENGPFSAIRQDLLDGVGVQQREGTTKAVMSYALYRQAQARYQEAFGDREYFMENLMVALFFYASSPSPESPEALWKSYVNFCNLYSFFRFAAVMSCREGAAGDRAELFRMIVYASRSLLHSNSQQSVLREEFFKNESATLAHMAILLCG